MTPEEKLLALIQQDKKRAEQASPPTVAPPSSPAPAPVQEPPKAVVQESPRVAPPPPPAARKPAPPPPPAEAPVAPPPPSPPKLKLAERKDEETAEAPAPEPDTKTAPVEDKPAPGPRSKPATGTSLVASMPLRAMGLVHLNRALSVVVVLLIACVVYSIGSIRPENDDALERQVTNAGRVPIPVLAVPEDTESPLETYLEKVSTRNIFMLKVASGAPGGARTDTTASGIKDLKLMAVSIDSATPDESTAIIRNKVESKTYFVKPGQAVGTSEYVVDKVLGDRVVLKFRKQELELR